MGVTIVRCSEKDCGMMLNGELCHFIGKKPYCEEHYEEKTEKTN